MEPYLRERGFRGRLEVALQQAPVGPITLLAPGGGRSRDQEDLQSELELTEYGNAEAVG